MRLATKNHLKTMALWSFPLQSVQQDGSRHMPASKVLESQGSPDSSLLRPPSQPLPQPSPSLPPSHSVPRAHTIWTTWSMEICTSSSHRKRGRGFFPQHLLPLHSTGELGIQPVLPAPGWNSLPHRCLIFRENRSRDVVMPHLGEQCSTRE